MILVEIYSKDECHLCEEAKTVLERVRREIPFELREIRLTEGDGYYEEYRELVPVVHVDKILTFRYRVNEHTLRIRLQQIIDRQNAELLAKDLSLHSGR